MEPTPEEVLTAIPDGQPEDLATAVADLVRRRQLVVPVIGSGLSAEAGAPSSTRLIEALRLAAGHPVAGDLYDVADTLEREHGTEWVQQVIARSVAERTVHPTTALRMLVQAPSGIVATTNYDDAVAVAAAAVGLQALTFGVKRLNEGLRAPERGTIHILHLHGHHADPATIVLTSDSYDAASNNQALRLALRVLVSNHVLAFFGQQLAQRERHVLDQLEWAPTAFESVGPHYMITDQVEVRARDDVSQLTDAAILIAPYRNDDGTHRVVPVVAQLVGKALPTDHTALPGDGWRRLYRPHVPLPIAPVEEIDRPAHRSAWEMVSGAFKSRLDVEDLLKRDRVLLYGAPGAGKSQTLLRVGELATDRQAVYVRLRPGSLSRFRADPVDEFVGMVADGEAFNDGVPRPTRKRLADTTYLFLLDGLDEVDREDRSSVLSIIAEVARRFPHLLFVVSSRRYHGLTDLDVDEFDVLELVPDRPWFSSYVTARGVTADQLDRTIPAGYPLQDLLRLPVFARAVADAALAGRSLPESPVDMILEVAEAALDRAEPELRADRDAVDRWLDGLAFIAEACHASEMPQVTVLDETVAGAYGIDPDEELLDHLVLRVLVATTSEGVQFPANIVQEARAARSLRNTADPHTLLADYALAELDDGTVGIHPSWRNTIELFCHDASDDVRDELSELDSRLVARATSSGAEHAVRRKALQDLLAFYDKHLVWWIDAEHHGQLRGDLDAASGLAATEDLHAVAIEWATDRLRHQERTLRGNALQLLVKLEATELIEASMAALLQDADSVVRRIALESHEALELEGHHAALRARLRQAPGELEQRALLRAWIRTEPDDEAVVVHLLQDWPAGMRSWAATSALDARFSRREQLQLLANHESLPEGWLDHLIDDTDADWTDDEVALLADVLSLNDDMRRRSYKVRPVLRRHLAAAVPVIWPRSEPDAKVLLYQATTAELHALLGAGLPDDVREFIDDLLDRRTALPDEADTTSAKVGSTEEPSPIDLVTGAIRDGWDGIARLQFHVVEAALRDAGELPGLEEMARQVWDEKLAQGESSFEGDLERINDHQIRGAPGTFALVQLAARYRFPLDQVTWMVLFELGWKTEHMEGWLRWSLQLEWLPAAEECLDSLSKPATELAADVLPVETLTVDAATTLVDRLRSHGDDHAVARYLRRLSDAERRTVLQRAHDASPTRITLRELARLGDCEAERQLLEAELSSPPPEKFGIADASHWLETIRCHESVGLLAERIIQAEAGDADHSYRSSLHAALRRSAGVEAVAIYDRMLDTRPFEDAPFLWFRRADAIDEFLAVAGPPMAPGDVDGARRIIDGLQG